MPFRTVIVSSHSKLEYSLNYLIYKTIEDTKKIILDEIHTLIIESTAVSITSALLLELAKKEIKVIFCDEKKNPYSELVSYYSDCLTTRKISEQIKWNDSIKNKVWKKIIENKIKNQAKVLEKVDFNSSLLLKDYYLQIEDGDITNREGHAAKVYFNKIYGDSFTRNGNNEKNVFLNYGYSILLSQFNKCIVSKGFLTQIGIHHKNDFNQFNLSCDFMEPYRPIVDEIAFHATKDDYKEKMINMLNIIVDIDGCKQTLVNSINIYCSSLFKALAENNEKIIKFFDSYEL